MDRGSVASKKYGPKLRRMKKDKLSGTVFYTAVGTRFELGSDGNAIYSW